MFQSSDCFDQHLLLNKPESEICIELKLKMVSQLVGLHYND